jgi:hypothetical protein
MIASFFVSLISRKLHFYFFLRHSLMTLPPSPLLAEECASFFREEKARQNSATEKRDKKEGANSTRKKRDRIPRQKSATKKSEQIPRGKSATEFSDRKARQKSTRKLRKTSQITVS